MHGPGTNGQPPAGARPVPVPGTRKDAEPETEKAAVPAKVAKVPCGQCGTKGKPGLAFCGACGASTTAAKSVTPSPLVALPTGDPAELVKAAVTEAIAPLAAQIKAQAERLAEQGDLIDQMAAAPDPRYAPFKGVGAGGVLPKAAAPVVEKTVVEQQSAMVQAGLLAEFQRQAREDPDPAKRETAWKVLAGMLSLPGGSA
jgi:hypothetical protein